MASLAQINIIFKADLKDFSSEMQSAKRQLEQVGKEWQKVGKEMSTYVTAPLAAIGGFASKINMDFDDSMRKVMATTNATADEFKALQATAEEMGAKTRYTASQAAEAMNYMALAGWKTNQIIEGIPGMLALAAASGEDLGMVSDILTDGLTAMGKAASDAGQFVDVLAAAASNSNTTVGMLGEAFQYAAPLAGALGFEVEDLALSIGLMSNAGIKGQKAGTALRAILTRLVKPTKESQKAMDALGVSVTNADGSIKPLSEILDTLRAKFANLTNSQKAQYAGMLAGQEAISGFLALVNAAPDDFDALSKAINNSAGTAKRMQDQMEGGIGGAWREMMSALEGVAIQIGQVLEPAFRKLTVFIKVLANQFMSLSDTTKTVIVVLGGLAAAIGPVMLAIGTMVKILPVLAERYDKLKVAIVATTNVMKANPIMAVSMAVIALGAALAAFTRDGDNVIKVQRTLNDVNVQAQKNIAAEKAELDTLIKTAKDETKSKEVRQQAIKKLNDISPEYLKNITLETINTKEATEQINKYIEALSRKAIEQAVLAKKTELFQKKIDVELRELGETGFLQDGFNKLWEVFGIGSDVVIRNADELEQYIKKLGATGKQADGLRQGFAPYLKQKEKDIALINEQVDALDKLMNAQSDSFIKPVISNGNDDDDDDKGDNKFLKGSVEFYQNQIKELEKLRDATATTSESYTVFGEKIAEVQAKIDELTATREKATTITLDIVPVPAGTIASYEKLIAQKREAIRTMEIGSMQYNALASEIQDLEFELKVKVDEAGFSQAQESIKNLQQSIEDQAKVAQSLLAARQEEAMIFASSVNDAFGQMSQGFLNSIGEVESGLARFGQTMAAMVMKLISMAMSNAIANSIVGATQSGNATGPAAVFTTPAFIATAVGGIMAAFASIPKFADGGIVSGPTFGLMGEYAGAANNPEVIAPLNKLKDLIEPASSAGGTFQVVLGGGFKVSGRDLQLVLDRNSTTSKRIG